MIGVSQNHLGSRRDDVGWRERFHGARCAHGHEGWRFDLAVRCGEDAATCLPVGGEGFELEAFFHRKRSMDQDQDQDQDQVNQDQEHVDPENAQRQLS